MEDELTDLLIPQLMDLFKMPEEQRAFILDFYIPEVIMDSRRRQIIEGEELFFLASELF
jgi:hypothetical protein